MVGLLLIGGIVTNFADKSQREEHYKNKPCPPEERTPDENAVRLGRVAHLQYWHALENYTDVLDIGCKDGFATRFFLDDPDACVTGIDLCEEAIEAAIAAVKDYPNQNCRYIASHYEDWDNHHLYDCVVAFEIIEHLPYVEGQSLIKYMSKSCGGRCFLSTPDEDGPWGRDNPDPEHICLYSPERLASALQEAGVGEFQIEKFHGLLIANWESNGSSS